MRQATSRKHVPAATRQVGNSAAASAMTFVPRPCQAGRGAHDIRRLEAIADALRAAVDERRLRTLNVAQSHSLRRQRVGAARRGCVADGTGKQSASLTQSEERDHVVLVHTVAGYANGTDKGGATVHRYATGKPLSPIGQLQAAGSLRRHQGRTEIDAGTAGGHIASQCAGYVQDMLLQGIDTDIKLPAQ